MCRRLTGQGAANGARGGLCEYGIGAGMLQIIGHPVYYLVAVVTKGFRVHIACAARLLCRVKVCAFFHKNRDLTMRTSWPVREELVQRELSHRGRRRPRPC